MSKSIQVISVKDEELYEVMSKSKALVIGQRDNGKKRVLQKILELDEKSFVAMPYKDVKDSENIFPKHKIITKCTDFSVIPDDAKIYAIDIDNCDVLRNMPSGMKIFCATTNKIDFDHLILHLKESGINHWSSIFDFDLICVIGELIL